MKPRDLPLSFLPAFEAAGRLGSFAAAAAELHLTPSAISQQIRSLEDALGLMLFERNGRTAVLTSAGSSYLCEVRRSLGEIAAATARVQRRARGSVLRMSTMALAAHEFLLPRLTAFESRFPELELKIECSNDYVDLQLTDFDAALRVGNEWPGVVSHALGELEVAVVCSQQLAREIHTAADLARYTLLDPWGAGPAHLAMLQAQAGVPPLPAARVRTFETCYDALRVAEHGLGIALACSPYRPRGCSSGAWQFRCRGG
jgi:LysR family glycine cleavage system transcriptional activator